MSFEKIIVLDDEQIIRKTLEQQLRKKRYSVASAGTLAEAQALLGKDKFDLMFVDVRLPDGEGIELLEMLQRTPDAPMVIMITGYPTIENAVKCMQMGAFSYIQKPFSKEEIEIHLKKAEEHSQAVTLNQYYSKELKDSGDIRGNSPAIQNLKKMIRRVSATDATVLITGENGTGKELVARELYRLSSRSGSAYVKVNCAAVSETLIESEFFGHEKGAFTGATERREGRFELAHNGSILLDEVSEIPGKLQAKLLRVLQEREFERVGGNRTMKVDVRVLATTNRDLSLAIERGEFRQDLFYRLNVFPINVPPLRERVSDVVELAEAFLKQSCRRIGIKLPGFSKEATECLQAHSWPGNVRELQNTIERSVILSEENTPVQAASLGIVSAPVVLSTAPQQSGADTVLGSAALPRAESAQKEDAGAAAPVATSKTLEQIEKEHILSVLKTNDGNRKMTAEALEVSIRTLRNKLNQYKEEGELV